MPVSAASLNHAPRNSSLRILLLGASGQVGWELSRQMSRLGQVIAPHRTPSDSWPSGVDLGRPESLRECVAQVRPHLIVNAAAYTAVDRAESEPDLAHAVNAKAPGILAAEAARIGAAIVHYSTDYVFDGSGTRPWREDDPIGPLNVYGHSKIAGEEAIRATGVPHLILRVSWIYGIRGHNFVKTMLRLGCERTELSVVADQIGAPTSARAIADATVQILEQSEGSPSRWLHQMGGAVHLAAGGETSWHGLALEIFRNARNRGVPLMVKDVGAIPSRQYPSPARRPENSRLDCSRLHDRFGIVPQEWKIALTACVNELLERERGGKA